MHLTSITAIRKLLVCLTKGLITRFAHAHARVRAHTHIRRKDTIEMLQEYGYMLRSMVMVTSNLNVRAAQPVETEAIKIIYTISDKSKTPISSNTKNGRLVLSIN